MVTFMTYTGSATAPTPLRIKPVITVIPPPRALNATLTAGSTYSPIKWTVNSYANITNVKVLYDTAGGGESGYPDPANLIGTYAAGTGHGHQLEYTQHRHLKQQL